MNVPAEWNVVIEPGFEWLNERARNDTSQFGEDGLIEAAFERFGAVNRWCFEVGAADGLFYSNTKTLRDSGWRSILIERDQQKFDSLLHTFGGLAIVRQHDILDYPLDFILADCGAPRDLDFGVIDIDGQDFWAWSDLRNYRPRVMLVEHDYGPTARIPERRGDGQASKAEIVELGKQKGYRLMVSTYCNCLFIREEELCPMKESDSTLVVDGPNYPATSTSTDG